MINNPNYKGKWKPAKIPNPDYFRDDEPFKMAPIGKSAIPGAPVFGFERIKK
jgi:Calreticulin family